MRTFYFRTHFTFTTDPNIVTLTASNLFDDGAIVYLNGEELYRLGMPVGAVNFNTLSPGGLTEGTYVVQNIPPERLLFGDNVLAIEVHQVNDTSTDAVMGFSLTVAFPPPVPLVITTQPQSMTVEDSHPAPFFVGISGQPAFYQWYKNGVAISNAIRGSYTIPTVTSNDAGNYHVIVTNSLNSVTSVVAILTVVPDTNAPTLVEADGTVSASTVLATFDYNILQSSATNLSNFRITNVLGAVLNITSAVWTNGSNVFLTTQTPRLANNNYILVVTNIRDSSLASNLLVTASMPIRSLVTVLALGDPNWRFYDPLPEFGDSPNLLTFWKEFTYAETNIWGDGASVFWNGDKTSIPGPAGSSLAQSEAITSYYRNTLQNVQFSPGGLRFLLTHIIDDGGVLYLNGQEIFRFNMPAGAVNYLTPASGQIPLGALARIGPTNVPISALRAGSNVVAFELHTSVAVDVDRYFGMQLDASVQSFPTGPVVITSDPQSITVMEGSSATFNVVQAGGATFQWQQTNNVGGFTNIAGATNDFYTIASVPITLNGAMFRVAVSNATASATSKSAILRVIPDTNAPTIVGANANTNSIVVSFSERMLATTANVAGNYFVTNTSGVAFAVTSAVLNNNTNVALSFASLPPGLYFVVVNNVRDASSATNVIAPNSVVRVGFSALVVPFGGSWRYDDTGTDRGPSGTWAARTYNDASWKGASNGVFAAERGVAPNGPGTVYAGIPEPVRTSMLLSNAANSAQQSTYYFRTHFNSFASGSGTMTIRTILDDGAVIYLNGVEIFRLRMADGSSGFGTLAIGNAVGTAGYEGPFIVPVANVLAGDNVIAVEAHQINLTSSDITWAGEFTLNIPSVVSNPGGCVASPVTPAQPTITYQRSGTNLVLTWPSGPVATNACGNTGLFVLQGALYLSNSPSTVVWSNLTTTSPFVVPIPTNRVPVPFGARFYRLRIN